MAWHSVSQAQTLTQKSRRTLYRDMATGRVSWRKGTNGHREMETAELIRAYGVLSGAGTEEWPTVTQGGGTQNEVALLAEIRELRAEVAELKGMMLRIEDKTSQKVQEDRKTPWWRFWGVKR